MRSFLSLLVCLAVNINSFAQETPAVRLSGYLEMYYGYDFNKPADNSRPAFIYSHNRHNEVNLNLGFIKGSFDDGALRANIALMAGAYANANYAAEPGVLKNVYEANAGVRLGKESALWLDAGIFSSHIGFESAVSKDDWVLTRNISSENTPYYESGAKLSYSAKDGKINIAVLYLNGWQRITRQDGNSKAAGGLQVTIKPSDRLTLNYSNYLGTEGPDEEGVKRIYHNFYSIVQLTDRLGLTAGFDYGMQQQSRESNDYNKVLSPVLITRFRFTDEWAIAGRFEYYEDKKGIFVPAGTPEGFRAKGYSLNLDYAPVSYALLRLEGKLYDSPDKVFAREDGFVNHNAVVTASIALSF